jgi:ABC-type multidrug transport system fused ATPase/permease subunit
MLVPLGFVGILYAKTMGKFRPAARDLKRSESKSRSPIYTHFREALKGVETIRVFPGSRSRWQSKHQHLTDDNLSVFYSIKALDRWLSVRLESLGNIVVFAAAVTSIFLSRAGYLKSGKAGWGITQSLSITGLLSWAVRTITESESSFMSVQRCAELTNLDSTTAQGLDHDPEEGKSSVMPTEYDGAEALTILYPKGRSHLSVPLAPPGTELVKSGWPWKGSVKFNDVSMRYNPSAPLVLKNVTASVPAGTTLGIVGRTGMCCLKFVPFRKKRSGVLALNISIFRFLIAKSLSLPS